MAQDAKFVKPGTPNDDNTMFSGKNVQITLQNGILTVVVDCGKDFGESAAGKSVIVGTTGGNIRLANGVTLSVNAYRRK